MEVKLAQGHMCMYVYVYVPAAVVLRNALEARGAEAALYRKQYEGLCHKLDTLEEHHRQASSAARVKVSPEALSIALAFGVWSLAAVRDDFIIVAVPCCMVQAAAQGLEMQLLGWWVMVEVLWHLPWGGGAKMA